MGKGKPGVAHHNAKLNDDQVREIRRRYRTEDISQLALATEYDIDQSTLWCVVHHKTWAHVTE